MDRIVGYTYAADTYCTGDCVISALGEAQASGGFETTESLLDPAAADRNIDRMDEYSFDSADFPKVVFGSSVDEPEHCGGCGTEIG